MSLARVSSYLGALALFGGLGYVLVGAQQVRNEASQLPREIQFAKAEGLIVEFRAADPSSSAPLLGLLDRFETFQESRAKAGKVLVPNTEAELLRLVRDADALLDDAATISLHPGMVLDGDKSDFNRAKSIVKLLCSRAVIDREATDLLGAAGLARAIGANHTSQATLDQLSANQAIRNAAWLVAQRNREQIEGCLAVLDSLELPDAKACLAADLKQTRNAIHQIDGPMPDLESNASLRSSVGAGTFGPEAKQALEVKAIREYRAILAGHASPNHLPSLANIERNRWSTVVKAKARDAESASVTKQALMLLYRNGQEQMRDPKES